MSSKQQVNQHDVILGKGAGSYEKEGNKFWRALLKENLEQLQTMEKNNKPFLYALIVAEVQSKGGRFMYWDKQAGRSIEITNDEAIQRTQQGFLNLLHNKKKNNEDPMSIDVAAASNMGSSGRNDNLSMLLEEIERGLPPDYLYTDLEEKVQDFTEKATGIVAAIVEARMAGSYSRNFDKYKSDRTAMTSVSVNTGLSFENEKDMPKIEIVTMVEIKKGRYYSGAMMDGKPHGEGYMLYEDNRMASGSWIRGVLDGKATIVYRNGGKYYGTMKANKRHGYGVYYSHDGSKYVGYWKDDKREGKGVYTDKEGTVFNGDFVAGKLEGYATKTPLGRETVNGLYKNGELFEQNPCQLSGRKRKDEDDSNDNASASKSAKRME